MATYFTSESVCRGHPDKICDIIADSILDEALKRNPHCRNSVEVAIKDDSMFIYGETDTPVDYITIAKSVLREIGYDDDFEIILRVSGKVSKNNSEGADDQGIVFGYACNETKDLMPLSISLAHMISRELDILDSPNFLPDGKTQVTVAYEDGVLKEISTIIISKQHNDKISEDEILDSLIGAAKAAVEHLGVKEYVSENTQLVLNPAGPFIIGGPQKSKGCTGRKIVVDTYGGHSRVGGGSFSSKDPSHIDRSAAYYARYVAKNIVAAGIARKCEVQVSYGNSIDHPISINIDCFGTNVLPMFSVYKYVKDNFDFSPSNIIRELNLRRPIYRGTACYGHFGNSIYPWEQIKN